LCEQLLLILFIPEGGVPVLASVNEDQRRRQNKERKKKERRKEEEKGFSSKALAGRRNTILGIITLVSVYRLRLVYVGSVTFGTISRIYFYALDSNAIVLRKHLAAVLVLRVSCMTML